jgi:BolA protein
MNRKQTIEQKLQATLLPLHLEITDETHMHSVPEDAQSHYRVVAVSGTFEGKPLLQRHRLINKALEEELADGIHALALHAMTPQEWTDRGGKTLLSPPCLGGGKQA